MNAAARTPPPPDPAPPPKPAPNPQDQPDERALESLGEAISAPERDGADPAADRKTGREAPDAPDRPDEGKT